MSPAMLHVLTSQIFREQERLSAKHGIHITAVRPIFIQSENRRCRLGMITPEAASLARLSFAVMLAIGAPLSRGLKAAFEIDRRLVSTARKT